MNISQFLFVNQPCDEVLQWAKGQLTLAGLRPVQTFDLHTARVGLHDCSCPKHGSAECDCQMVVVLVYGQVNEPVTIILHGNDGQTWLSMAEDPTQNPDTGLRNAIHQALEAKTRESNAL